MTEQNINALFVVNNPEAILADLKKFLLEGISVMATDSEWDTTEYLLYDSSFDVVLLDIKVGKQNGLDILKRIKDDERIRRLPIVIFSDEDNDETRKKAIELGAVDFIVRSGLSSEYVVNKIKEIFIGGKYIA